MRERGHFFNKCESDLNLYKYKMVGKSVYKMRILVRKSVCKVQIMERKSVDIIAGCAYNKVIKQFVS